ncbi:MAG TPA: hypothetical protein VMU92_13400 [Acidobacteriaceae bacterium]|nr:hypothetical protein [Acidobacteriaceae bacterium]
MDIRTATQADLPFVLKLVNSAFGVERFFKNQDRLNAGDLDAHFRSGNFLLTEDAAPYPSEREHMLTQPVHFICMSKELGHRP